MQQRGQSSVCRGRGSTIIQAIFKQCLPPQQLMDVDLPRDAAPARDAALPEPPNEDNRPLTVHLSAAMCSFSQSDAEVIYGFCGCGAAGEQLFPFWGRCFISSAGSGRLMVRNI